MNFANFIMEEINNFSVEAPGFRHTTMFKLRRAMIKDFTEKHKGSELSIKVIEEESFSNNQKFKMFLMSDKDDELLLGNFDADGALDMLDEIDGLLEGDKKLKR